MSASNRARLDSLVEGMSGLVDRADVAERVDQGVGSSPFTRLISKSLSLNFSLFHCWVGSSPFTRLISKSLSLNSSLFHRMGAVFMQNYLDYYNSLIPNTKFSSRIVRLVLRRLDNWFHLTQAHGRLAAEVNSDQNSANAVWENVNQKLFLAPRLFVVVDRSGVWCVTRLGLGWLGWYWK